VRTGHLGTDRSTNKIQGTIFAELTEVSRSESHFKGRVARATR
jgi:hypothetical protein